jgi:uncharacterized protein (DUF433 family)
LDVVENKGIAARWRAYLVLKGTRMPVQRIFENLEAGLSVREITEVFDVTEQE